VQCSLYFGYYKTAFRRNRVVFKRVVFICFILGFHDKIRHPSVGASIIFKYLFRISVSNISLEYQFGISVWNMTAEYQFRISVSNMTAEYEFI